MAKIYVAYGTVEGQAAKIAEFMAGVIRDRGHEAQTVDLAVAGLDWPAGAEAMIVGASVHVGRHEESVRAFVRANRTELERVPSALFSVSLAAAHGGEAEARKYVEKFEADTGWAPGRSATFAGALVYSHYGFLKRHVMKRIARSTGSGDTDTARDYEYTDWDGVRRFTEDFLDGVGS